jgi:ABC-2 type transport system ATP-binding protein
MKQKIALARALLHDPPALFLDEPTAGLDPQAAHSVRELIVSLKHASRGIVLCTHDLDEAERLADQVAIISHGRILAAGSVESLRRGASASTLVRIELAAPCDVALDELGYVNGITAAAMRNGHANGGTVLEYRTEEPRRVNPLVLTRLIARHARVVSVMCDAPALEQVYFDVLSHAAGSDTSA